MVKLGIMVALVAVICVSAAALANSRFGNDPDSLGGTVAHYAQIGLHSVLSIRTTFESVAADVRQATGTNDD